MRRLATIMIALSMAVSAACGGSSAEKHVTLDGRPRYPDAEGVVTAVSADRITLDGTRTFNVSKRLQCFATDSLRTVSLLQRKNQYVQVGVSGRTVTWLAAVAPVSSLSQPTVFYNGRLVRLDGKGRAVFRDGTVFQTDGGMTAPPSGSFVRAEIDPARHLVRRLAIP